MELIGVCMVNGHVVGHHLRLKLTVVTIDGNVYKNMEVAGVLATSNVAVA